MGEDRPTPPGLPPSRYLIDELRAQVAAHDERLGRIRTQQIEAFGSDGHGGFVGRLVADQCGAHKAVLLMEKRLDIIEREASALRTKLGLVVAVASMAAGAAVSIVTRLLGG